MELFAHILPQFSPQANKVNVQRQLLVDELLPATCVLFNVRPEKSVLTVIRDVVATNEYHTSLLVVTGFQQVAAVGLPVLVAFTLVPWVQPRPTDKPMALQIRSLPGTCADTVELIKHIQIIATGVRILRRFLIGKGFELRLMCLGFFMYMFIQILHIVSDCILHKDARPYEEYSQIRYVEFE